MLRRLETLGKPVVAAINGAALGGGLEICLACHHRVIVDDPKAVVGFPEVQLGLLPGAGGVVRSVRMLGIVDALMQLLLQGQRLKPAKAQGDGHRRRDRRLASTSSSRPRRSGSRRRARTSPASRGTRRATRSPAARRRPRRWRRTCRPSRPTCASSSRAPTTPPRTTSWPRPSRARRSTSTRAFEIEGRYFVDLATGQVAKNMIQAFFFDLQAVNGTRGRPDDIETFQSKKVVVLGAGMMGAAIAYVCAKSGIEVVLKDVDQEAAERGKGYCEKLVAKGVERGKVTPGEGRRAARRASRRPTDPAAADGADLVIEAVFEDPKVKAAGVRRDRAAPRRRRAAGLQHLDAADHRPRRVRVAAGRLHRAALLQPGGQDAAAGDHQGREDDRRDALPGARRRQADRQDADRRQRLARLLHLARDRHVHQRGHRDAHRGRARRRRSSRPPRRPATRRPCCSSPTSST